MPEQLVLVLTDIIDSTAVNAAVGDVAMRGLWEAHDRFARGLIRECGGREIGRSDGFLIVFGAVDDAVAFAAAYHRSLDTLVPPLRARVGVHAGEVTLRENAAEDVAAGATRYDIDGLALPVAARICAVARGRQTLLSGDALARLGATRHKVISHGMWQFKGPDEPIELFEVGDEDADLLPPEDGDKGYRVTAVDGSWLPAREIHHSIPADRDHFVGRQAELRKLAELVTSGARLVSVVGVGGVGKTRLAKHFARRWLGGFVGGAWFCDLAEARDDGGIYSAVAQGLDLSLGRSDPPSRLADAIASRGRCLVLLDNCEQVLEPLSAALSPWLDRAPRATFLITTRERIAVTGEHVCVVDSLGPAEASELFARRAALAAPDFRVAPSDATAIDELVELLDRLPLAIELAAGRLGVLSPVAMLRRLGERFTMLSARSGSRPRRQLTLRAALDWSWDLLAAEEQSLLAQVSVFSGGFRLEAAEAVLAMPPSHLAGRVLDTLQSLVDKSLVRHEGERFSLLVSVREYAAEMLRQLAPARPELEPTVLEARHGRYFADLTKGDAADLENILTACRRAVSRRDVALVPQTCITAWRWLESRGPLRTAIELVESALAVDGLAPADRFRLTYFHGRSLLVSGNLRGARQQLTSAHEGARSEGSTEDELRALASLAELNVIEGRLDQAKLQYEEFLRESADMDAPAFRCAALNGLGVYYNRLGQFRTARSLFEQALEEARSGRDLRWEGGALSNLGLVEANLGNREAAKRFYDQAIVVARALGDRVWEGNLLCNLGLFHLEGGDAEAARSELARSLVLARECGLSLLESVVWCNTGLLNEAAGEDDAAERAYREALAIARRRGDQRSQGQFLAYLGLVLVRHGQVAEGRSMADESIEILRRVRDRLSLAISLCRRAQACVRWGDVASARASLAEAAALADEIGVVSGSELATSLEQSRRAIEASATGA